MRKHVKSRRSSSAARSSKPARKAAPKSVAEYVRRMPDSARSNFAKLRAAIRSAVPKQASETISYGIPAFRDKPGIIVWFAAFSKHCSLFPTAAVIAACKKELEGYSVSKGTVQFPNSRPLPAPLVKKLVKARLAQYKGKR